MTDVKDETTDCVSSALIKLDRSLTNLIFSLQLNDLASEDHRENEVTDHVTRRLRAGT